MQTQTRGNTCTTFTVNSNPDTEEGWVLRLDLPGLAFSQMLVQDKCKISPTPSQC